MRDTHHQLHMIFRIVQIEGTPKNLIWLDSYDKPLEWRHTILRQNHIYKRILGELGSPYWVSICQAFAWTQDQETPITMLI